MKSLLALVVCALVFESVSSQRQSTCQNTFCPRGRRCVAQRGGGTICECPIDCSNIRDPVCSVYGKQFINICHLHKFACGIGISIAVKHRGACIPEEADPRIVSCSDYQLLQFPNRFLDWLMIAREQSLNPRFRLGRRAEDLRGDEIRNIVAWEFDNIDQDKNREIDDNEVKEIEKVLLPLESCVHGFLRSCDLDGVDGISPDEWTLCFPKGVSGEAIGSRQ